MIDAPLFATARAALRFALNATQGLSHPSPSSLNLMMAEVIDEVMKEQDKKEPERRIISSNLRGLSTQDKLAVVASIRNSLGELDIFQQAVVTARLASPSYVCECKARCCSGAIGNREWLEALTVASNCVFEHLKAKRQKSMRGVEDKFHMRRLIVLMYFTDEASKMSMESVARECSSSPITVASHVKMINPILSGVEKAALTSLDERLTTKQIVGAIL